MSDPANGRIRVAQCPQILACYVLISHFNGISADLEQLPDDCF